MVIILYFALSIPDSVAHQFVKKRSYFRKGYVFDSVDGAADIWNLTFVQRVVNKNCFNFRLKKMIIPFIGREILLNKFHMYRDMEDILMKMIIPSLFE